MLAWRRHECSMLAKLITFEVLDDYPSVSHFGWNHASRLYTVLLLAHIGGTIAEISQRCAYCVRSELRDASVCTCDASIDSHICLSCCRSDC